MQCDYCKKDCFIDERYKYPYCDDCRKSIGNDFYKRFEGFLLKESNEK